MKRSSVFFLLLLTLSQTACITTLHTQPYVHERRVQVLRHRPIVVVPRAPETVVTVRRY